jgi:glyoxylase-like metal-dependent hydrolase (beta-lactamase superfamily II)
MLRAYPGIKRSKQRVQVMAGRGDLYRIEIVRVGQMAEVPTCAIYTLEKIGQYEPFCYTLCILRSDRRIILINTGFPADVDAIRQDWIDTDARCILERPDSMRIENILAERGIAPAQVTDVFLTPFGPYNTGNISLFRNASIYMLRRGWAYLMGLDEDLPRLRLDIAIPRDELIYLVTDGFDRLILLQDEAEPLPGIRTFYAGVHHPASMALAISTTDGMAIFSDAFFKFGNIEQMKPIGYCQDLRQCMRSYRRIAAEADMLIPMYDPENFVRYPDGIIG